MDLENQYKQFRKAKLHCESQNINIQRERFSDHNKIILRGLL